MAKMMTATTPKTGRDLGNFVDPGNVISVVTGEHSILQEVPR